jgi:hypothetical protein
MVVLKDNRLGSVAFEEVAIPTRTVPPIIRF